jgi:hypothetical protein
MKVIGRIREIEVVAAGGSIRDIARLRKQHGAERWRKMKGTAELELADGTIRTAEIHWYEAHGVGKKNLKIKRFLD